MQAETRAELIDPQLQASGWGIIEGSKVLRERHITAGKIQTGGKRGKPLITDYILVYKNRQLAVIEAKSDELSVGEGVAQAKNYAEKLNLNFTYSANGKENLRDQYAGRRRAPHFQLPHPRRTLEQNLHTQRVGREIQPRPL